MENYDDVISEALEKKKALLSMMLPWIRNIDFR
jgi:hypothetical protein